MELLLGVFASGIVQFFKRYFPNRWYTFLLLAATCLVLASGYTALVATDYWPTVAGILMTAGAFYTFFIQQFEK